ncbi:twitchin-like isoform X2 [Antedon mediterranea]|uniref:twitchin-like isoform X2 n=1 Tax=Antedon mediterranea TaxID=105859 RepID=UPI003AF75448
MVKDTGPSFVKKPYINQSDDGKILTFACKVAADPRPTVTWLLNNKEVKDGGRYTQKVKPDGGDYLVSMEINDIAENDAGSYKVCVKNKFGDTSATIALNFGGVIEEQTTTKSNDVDGVAPNFTMKPKMSQSDDASKLTIECELCAIPRPDIKWYLGDKELKDGGRLKIGCEEDGEFYFLSLDINNLNEKDGGDYKIIATNKLGTATNTIKLNFAAPDNGAPSFTMKPKINQSKDGTKLSFLCELTAEPEPTLTWYKDNVEIKQTGRYKMTVEYDDEGYYFVLLSVSDVTEKDGGKYTVVAKNSLGETKSTIDLNFDSTAEDEAPKDKSPAGIAPTFLDKPTMSQSEDGHELTFEAKLKADPKPSIVWYFNNQAMKDGGRFKISIKQTAGVYVLTLNIKNVTPKDGGSYKIEAKNTLGVSTSTINLNFNITEGSRQGAPSFIEKPNIKQEDEGRHLIFEIKVMAEPSPTVTWYYGNKTISDGGRYKTKTKTQGKIHILILDMTGVTPSDAGNYRVVVNNAKGEATSTINISFEVQAGKPKQVKVNTAPPLHIDFISHKEVVEEYSEYSETVTESSTEIIEEKIKVVKGLKDQDLIDGDKLTLRVKFSSKPITVNWFLDGKPLQPSPDYEMKEEKDEYVLIMEEVFPEDSGDYSVVGKNSSSEVRSICEVYVEELKKPAPKPSQKDKPQKIEEKVEPKKDVKQQSKPPGKEPTKPVEEKPIEVKKTAPKEESAPVEEKPIAVKKTAPKEESAPPPVEEKPIAVKKTAPKEESAPPAPEKKPAPKDEKIEAVNKKPAEKAPSPGKGSPAKAVPEIIVPEEPTGSPSRQPAENGSLSKQEQLGYTYSRKSIDELEDSGQPYFLQSPCKAQVTQGQSVKFEAIVAGNPKPTVSWFKGNSKIEHAWKDRYFLKYHAQRDVHIMEIRKANKVDAAGHFVCKVENMNGRDERMFTLIVTAETANKDRSSGGELDFRSMLKHREVERRESKIDVPDWGELKHVEGEEKRSAEITRPLKAKKVNERDGRARLDCGVKFTGVKPQWYKNGDPINPGRKYKMFARGAEVELEIQDLNIKDSGEYEVAFEELAHTSCELTVEQHHCLATMSNKEFAKLVSTGELPKDAKKPRADFISLLKNQEVKENADAKFSVEVSADRIESSWYVNGKKVTFRDAKKYETKKLGRKHTLIIKKVAIEDQGDVKVELEGRDSTATLTVKAQPKFTKPLKDKTAIEKRSTSLECEVSDYTSKVKWTRNGKPLTETDNIKMVMDGLKRVLIIDKLSKEDAGEYMAEFEGLKSVAKLTVSDSPKFAAPMKQVEGFAGKDAVFEAEVTDKDVDVLWAKDGKAIQPSDKYEMIQEGKMRKLIVHDLKADDEGEYLCGMDEDTLTTAPLTVNEPPRAVVPNELKNIEVVAGKPISLDIDIYGSPPPKVQWLKDGKPIVENDRVKVEWAPEYASLLIENSERGDTGTLTLVLNNAHGTEKIDFKATVIDKPATPENVVIASYDEKSVTVGWAAPLDDGGTEIENYVVEYKEVYATEWLMASDKETGTQLKIPDLIEKKEYKFRVSAVNKVGKSKPQEANKSQVVKEPFDPPDPPKPPVVTECHDGKIGLKWDPPKFDGGCPIQGYVLEKKEPGSKRWTKVNKDPIKETEFMVDNLPEDGEIQFRVAAVNKAGPSEPSEASKPAVAKEPIEPTSAPTELKIGDVTKNSMELSWTKPAEDGGSPIKGYHVEKKNPKTGEWERVNKYPIKDTHLTVPDLVEGEEYELRVIAENEAGMSEPSEASQPTVAKDPEIPPSLEIGDLKDVTVKAGNMVKFEVKFSGSPTPTCIWTKDDGPLQGDDHIRVQTNAVQTAATIATCERSDTGKYKLSVSNPFGTETASVTLTVLDKPEAPQGPLEASKVFANYLTLSWNPPADDGGVPITNYVIEKRDTRRSNWSVVNDTTTDTSIQVQKLVEGVEYAFRVYAENAQGQSKALDMVKPVVAKNPFVEPGVPGTPEVKDYDKDFVEIGWTKPKSDGGAPIEGYIVERKEKNSNRWVEVTDKPIKGEKMKVTDVVPGKEYEFRVTAVNKAGPGKPSQASTAQKVKPKFAKPEIAKDAMRDQKVRAGQQFKLEVPISGEPPPTVIWKKNGKVIEPSDHVKIETTEDKTVLCIPDALRDDFGDYELELVNDSGTVSEKCKINVLDKPSPPEGPIEITEITANTCKLAWKPPLDDGGSEISNYIVEKCENNDGDWERVSGYVNTTSLQVSKLRKGSAYKFRVVAENGHGGMSSPLESEEIIAKNAYDEPDAPGKPKILAYDRDHVDLEWETPKSDGGDKIFGYTVERKDPRSNRWIKVNKSPVMGNKMTAKGLVEGKEYQFRVTAENKAGLGKPSEESDVVTAKPQFEKPKVDTNLMSGREIRVRAGETFDFKVPFVGSPPPTATWYKDNRELKLSDRVSVETSETDTVIFNKKAERGDSGNYKINLENNRGSDSVNVKVTVLDKPTAPKGPIAYSEFSKTSVKLSWEPPEDDGGCNITGYVVEVTEAGHDKWTIATSSVHSTNYTVHDLIEHQNYKFRVSATNQCGTGPPLDGKPVRVKLPFDEPDSPSIPVVEEMSKSSATVAWTPPANDGGSPITGYFVEYKEPDSNKWIKANSFPLKDNKLTIPGLDEGKEYEFRVAAENEAGVGKPSRASSPAVAEDPVVTADAPGKPVLSKIRKNSANVTWTSPMSDGGAKISDYVVQKKKPGSKDEWQDAVTVPATETSATVPDLVEGDKYEFRVLAKNAKGLGKPSQSSGIITAEDHPEEPQLDIGDLTDFKVKVSEPFKMCLNFTGIPIPVITWSMDGHTVKEDGTRKTITNSSTETKFVVDSAKRCDGGRYTVSLKNPSGSDSARVKVTVYGIPDPPEGPVEISDVGPDTVTLSWKAPAHGKEDIDNYVVEKKAAGTGEWEKVSSFVPGTTFKVRKLDEGTEYEFRVKAENTFGESEPLKSESVVAKNPFDAPGSPGTPVAKDTDKTAITISWSPPKNDGGSPITGYIVEKKEAGSNRWVPATRAPIRETTFTAGKLTEGKEYDFRVKAQNKAGDGKPSETAASITAAPPASKPRVPSDERFKEVRARAGEQYRVVIPFTGAPAPTVTWVNDDKGGTAVEPSTRIKFETNTEETVLINLNAQRDDTGKYTVTLKNPKGEDTVSVRVTVFDAPGTPEGPLEASDVTAESVRLSWKPPKDDGGTEVSNYVVEKSEEGSGVWTKVSGFVRSPNYEVTGLDEGVSYNFRVSAENEFGTSEPLVKSVSVTAKNPYDAADKPGKPEIKEVDKGFVTLAWKPPDSDGGSRITGYIVESRSDDSDWTQCNIYPVKDCSFSVSNLDENAKYEFRVRAKNAAGLSQPSASSDTVFPKSACVPPGKPGTPQIGQVTPTTVELNWTKPVSDGGSRITGYVVELKPTDSDNWTKSNKYPVKEPHFTVDDLTQGREYEFRVRAQNEAGVSEPSNASQPVVPKAANVGSAPYFDKPIDDTSTPKGEQAKFECKVVGRPAPQVKWFKNGIELYSGFRVHMRENDNTYSLVLDDIQESDQSEITCEISNKAGKASCSAKLKVEVPPKIAGPPRDVQVESGSPFKVKVLYDGKGKINARWTKDGEPVEADARIKQVVFDDYVMFTAREAVPDDAGDYKVAIGNDIGEDSVIFTVDILSPPGPPENFDVGRVTDTSITIAWKPPKKKGGCPIKNYVTERKEDGTEAWVTVGSFIKDTTYVVQGLTTHKLYHLRVSAENDIGIGKPVATSSAILAKNPFDAPSKPGVPDVTEVGKDFVNLIWARPESDGGRPILGYFVEKAEAGTDRWVRVSKNPVVSLSYNLPNLIEDRNYEFRVFAVNEGGLSEPSTASTAVKIKDPKEVIRPKILKALEDTTVEQGKAAKFEVSYTGKPKPDIRWFKGQREIYSNDKYLISFDGDTCILNISQVFGEDSDEYSCEISNIGGKKFSRADLIIKCPPKIKLPPRFRDIVYIEKGQTIKLKIPITGLPKPKSSWSKDGTNVNRGVEAADRYSTLTVDRADRQHSGLYKISAENALGKDSATINVQVCDVPDPATNLKAQDVTFESVELTWNAPTEDGGSPITGYVVEKRPADMDSWIRAASTSMTSCIVSMLDTNTPYKFRLRVDNVHGSSEYAEVSHTISIPEPERLTKRIVIEDEAEAPLTSRVPKVSDYDNIVDLDDPYVTRKVKPRKSPVESKYYIGEEIGRGDFGVVYRAVEKATGKNFAAKFIDIDSADIPFIRKEVDAMTNLQYPRLQQLHDVFETDDKMVLILDFLSGGDAFQRCLNKNYVLTEAEVAMYTKQVCEGLNHIHTRNYMHLALRPQSVLFETKRTNAVRLIDYGMATKLDPDQRAKLAQGSTDFLAPEVIEGSEVGFCTDMWTVGVICYMLLSGIHPFDADKDKIKDCKWQFDKDAFKPISDEAKDFIERLLIKDKDKRMGAHEALEHPWLKDPSRGAKTKIPTDRHRSLLEGRPWLAGTAVVGVGRLGDSSGHRRRRPLKNDFVADCGISRKDARPRFIKRPHDMMVKEGGDVALECQIAAASAPMITWWRGDVELKQSLKHKNKQDGIRYCLQVGVCTMDDAGEYTVKAKNSFGDIQHKVKLEVLPDPLKRQDDSASIKRTFVLKVFAEEIRDCKAMFTFRLRHRNIQLHDTVKLSCIVEAIPEAKITWFVNDKEVTKNSSEYSIGYSSGLCTLDISKVKESHAAKYSCKAVNSLGEDITECFVTVEAWDVSGRRLIHTFTHSDVTNSSLTKSSTPKSKPAKSEPSYKGPIIMEKPKSQKFKEGERVKLICKLADPATSFEWLKDNVVVEHNEPIILTSEGAVYGLEIPVTLATDAGNYSIKAKNKFGECQAKFSLQKQDSS